MESVTGSLLRERVGALRLGAGHPTGRERVKGAAVPRQPGVGPGITLGKLPASA